MDSPRPEPLGLLANQTPGSSPSLGSEGTSTSTTVLSLTRLRGDLVLMAPGCLLGALRYILVYIGVCVCVCVVLQGMCAKVFVCACVCMRVFVSLSILAQLTCCGKWTASLALFSMDESGLQRTSRLCKALLQRSSGVQRCSASFQSFLTSLRSPPMRVQTSVFL